jgi:hypothetical protein
LKVVVEIKDFVTVETSYSKFQKRWEKCKNEAKKKGILFTVITDEEIRTPRLANIWFTLSSSKCRITKKEISTLKSLIPKEGINYQGLCLNLAEYLGGEITSAAQIICYAIYHGLVFVDLFSTRNLSNSTNIRKIIKTIGKSVFPSLWEEYNWDFIFADTIYNDIHRKESNDDETILLKSLNSTFIPEKYRNDVEFRLKVVEEWNKQPSKKRTFEWRIKFIEKLKSEHNQKISILVKKGLKEQLMN